MARQFLRRMAFTFDGGAGRTIYGGRDRELRLTANIKASTIQSPNEAALRVWNPSPALIRQADEFSRVTVRAGYDTGGDADLGLIYAGDVKQALYGRGNAVDTYLDVFCAGGGNAYQRAIVSKTLMAGHTPMDHFQVALDAMAPFGITKGLVTADLSKPVYPRGVPLVGMARSLLREIGLSAGALWSIQNDQLCVVDHKKPLPGVPVVLNSQTGMLGIPEQTTDGVSVRCLMRPENKVHGLVQIDQSSINQAERNNNALTGGAEAGRNFDLANTGKIASDGIYQVIILARELDTRGQAWWDDMMCIAQHGGSPNAAQLMVGAGIADPTLGAL